MSGYDKTEWFSGALPAISAFSLAKIEDGVEAAIGVDSADAVRNLPLVDIYSIALRCSQGGSNCFFDWDPDCSLEEDGILDSLGARSAGTVIKSNAVSGAGRFVRRREDAHFYSISWYLSDTFTATENTRAIQQLLDLQASNYVYGTKSTTTIDLAGELHEINDPCIITAGGLVLRNGGVHQLINTKDCLQTDADAGLGDGKITFVRLENYRSTISGDATILSGSHFRHLSGTLAWFKWESPSQLILGGKHGFINGYDDNIGVNGKIGGNIWATTFDGFWTAKTYSSSILIDEAGRNFSMSANAGGITTLTIANFAAAYIVSADPAIKVNSTELILTNAAADYCTTVLQARVKQLRITNIATEFMRAPIDPVLSLVFYSSSAHKPIDISTGSVTLNGFKNHIDPGYLSNPHPNFIQCYLSQVTGTIDGFVGTFPNFGVRLFSLASRINTTMPPSDLDVTATQGQISYIASRQSSTSAITSPTPLFPIDANRPRAYLITVYYSFLGKNDITTILVHTSDANGGMMVTTNVLLEGDEWGTSFIDGDGTNVVLHPPFGNKPMRWSAVDLLSM